MFDKAEVPRPLGSGAGAELRKSSHVETLHTKLENISARLHDCNMRLDQHADKLIGVAPPPATPTRSENRVEASSQLHRVAQLLETINGQLDFLQRNVGRYEEL